ncbi:C-terminal binding protein, partial [Dehalococcoidia bacterium]|nr:C-terminal binding protein [Dehalococcoidia bacterium]
MSKLIWIIDEEWKDYEIEEQLFKREVPDYKVKHSNNQYMKDLEDFGKYAEAILAQIYVDIPGETISKLENCKVISVYGGGFDRVNLDAAKEKGIIVTYVPAYCLEEVSD